MVLPRSSRADSFKLRLFAQFARIGKAASHPHRLILLEYLAQGERSVETLARLAGLSMANTSQHLQLLRQAGLVTARKEGLYVYYELASPSVTELLAVLEQIARSSLAEVDQLVRRYLTVKDGLEPVSQRELLTRAKQGLVTVLDVRPSEEYEAGHISGAVNIPLNQLKKELHALSRDLEVVAYCRGPYCVMAYEAVAKLREKGFKARRLQDGFPEWRLAGLPVEHSGTEPNNRMD
jgi:rhodanese-related sulfurtransferase/predicted transcriptional regulator